jgi:hypothetical protein
VDSNSTHRRNVAQENVAVLPNRRKMWRMLRSLGFIAISLIACGGRVDLPGDPNDGAIVSDSSTSDDTSTTSDTTPPPRDTGPGPMPTSCKSSAECGDKAFCKVETGCGGTGVCARRPEGCDLLYAPVCGCDGKTYGNECAAWQAGAIIAYKGECKTPVPTACPGGCAKSEYCKVPDGTCATTGGMCTKFPMGCPDIYAPVCGCDGKTYPNSCDAATAAMNIKHKGPC